MVSVLARTPIVFESPNVYHARLAGPTPVLTSACFLGYHALNDSLNLMGHVTPASSCLGPHRLSSSRIDQLEYVVLDVVIATVLRELESLDIAHRLWLIVDNEGAGDHDKDTSPLVRWLRVLCVYPMLNLLEWE
jgi:hypothetical protein